MRKSMIALPLLLAATPAMAETQAEADKQAIELPAEMLDPQMGEKMGKMLGALSKAMLDLKIGEVEAIAKGRDPAPADRDKRLRDVVPEGGKQLERQAEAAGPMLQKGMAAMAKALPAIMDAMRGVADEIEGDIDRATANMPQPGYPKR